MATTTFDKHIAAITAGVVTKTNVIGLRKALNSDTRRTNGWSTSSTAPAVDANKIEQTMMLLSEKKPLVAGELHDTGLKQLRDRRYRRQLEAVTDIIDNLTAFSLVGFEHYGRRGECAYPVFKASDHKGRSFTFINVPWQSGGKGPEVVEID